MFLDETIIFKLTQGYCFNTSLQRPTWRHNIDFHHLKTLFFNNNRSL